MTDSNDSTPIMNLNFRDRDTLYAAYMPFLSQGGLFVPTDHRFEIGDEVSLLLQLPEIHELLQATGRVVWLNPRATAGRPAGIGIHFDKQSSEVNKRIESLLATLVKSGRPTYTM